LKKSCSSVVANGYAAQHRKERRAYGEALRARQGQVFQDVGAAVAAVGDRREGDQERDFGRVVGHVDVARARLRIDVLFNGRLQGGDVVAADFFKRLHEEGLEDSIRLAYSKGAVRVAGRPAIAGLDAGLIDTLHGS
jgi:hypothetical protein